MFICSVAALFAFYNLHSSHLPCGKRKASARIPCGRNKSEKRHPVTADVYQQFSVSDSASLRRHHSDPLVGNLTPFRFPICIVELSHVFFSCFERFYYTSIMRKSQALRMVCILCAYCRAHWPITASAPEGDITSRRSCFPDGCGCARCSFYGEQ